MTSIIGLEVFICTCVSLVRTSRRRMGCLLGDLMLPALQHTDRLLAMHACRQHAGSPHPCAF